MEISYTGNGDKTYRVMIDNKTICTTKSSEDAEKIMKSLAICDAVDTALSNVGLPSWEEAVHNLHDSDWGWIDSQSYYNGAGSMYRRIKWLMSKKQKGAPQNNAKTASTAKQQPQVKTAEVDGGK